MPVAQETLVHFMDEVKVEEPVKDESPAEIIENL